MPLIIPTIDGDDVFGLTMEMTTKNNPRARQQSAASGLSGLESLDGGMRGRFTAVKGLLTGYMEAGLAEVEEALRAFEDGVPHVLYDTEGRTWVDVYLDSFEPQGRGLRDTSTGYCFRYYTALLSHLT